MNNLLYKFFETIGYIMQGVFLTLSVIVCIIGINYWLDMVIK